jgi:hypothetical protein
MISIGLNASLRALTKGVYSGVLRIMILTLTGIMGYI